MGDGMKYVIIGTSGHHHQIAQWRASENGAAPAAVAKGSEREDMRALASAFGAREYDDYIDMLEAERPDIAVVNPWYCDNARVSAECMKRGVHVYSEKPLATELDALDALESLWRASGVSLGCMLNLNCCAWFLTLKRAIDEGEIGEVRIMHAQKSYRMGTRPAQYLRVADYGGTLPWVGTHAIDWTLILGGKCVRVCASASARANRGHGEMQTSAAALIEFENGAIATINCDFLRPDGSARHDDDRLRVTGTRGMLEVIDGEVYLENEHKRRALQKIEGENPFTRFLRVLDTPECHALAQSAFDASRVSLIAQLAATEHRTIDI